MTIVMAKEPKGGRAIVHDELGHRRHRSFHALTLHGEVQTGAPLPVYILGAKEASIGDSLANVPLVGWRYPVMGGASTGLVYLRRDGGHLKFAGLSEGRLAGQLMKAAILAEDNLGSHAGEFEPRLLEIPSLRLCALWLHGSNQQNFFIVLEDGRGNGDAPLQLERNFQPRLNAALADLQRPAAAPPIVAPREIGPRTVNVRWPLFIVMGLVVAVAFGARWMGTLSANLLAVWLIELALLFTLFGLVGLGARGNWFGVLIDGRNKLSLSRIQIVAWTLLFVDTFFVIYAWNIWHPPIDPVTNAANLAASLNLTVPNAIWILMGMSGVSAAASPAILSAKSAPAAGSPPLPAPSDATKFLDGIVVKRKAGEAPHWSDIFLGDEAGNADDVDISKLQQFLLTVVAVMAYGAAIAYTIMATTSAAILKLPDMDTGFLALIGASNATYLAYKAVSHSN